MVKFCSECGVRFSKNVKFCPHCGAQISEETAPPANGTQSVNQAKPVPPQKNTPQHQNNTQQKDAAIHNNLSKPRKKSKFETATTAAMNVFWEKDLLEKIILISGIVWLLIWLFLPFFTYSINASGVHPMKVFEILGRRTSRGVKLFHIFSWISGFGYFSFCFLNCLLLRALLQLMVPVLAIAISYMEYKTVKYRRIKTLVLSVLMGIVTYCAIWNIMEVFFDDASVVKGYIMHNATFMIYFVLLFVQIAISVLALLKDIIKKIKTR